MRVETYWYIHKSHETREVREGCSLKSYVLLNYVQYRGEILFEIVILNKKFIFIIIK